MGLVGLSSTFFQPGLHVFVVFFMSLEAALVLF